MKKIKTPCYIIDIAALEKNLKILKDVALKTGCKILLAQKCFSIYQTYPLISKYLDGTCSSGLNELKLAHEYFKKEKHIFAAAYRDDEISQIINIADTIIFNSIYQLEKYGNIVKSENKKAGIRINPECSTQKGDGIYDPSDCPPFPAHDGCRCYLSPEPMEAGAMIDSIREWKRNPSSRPEIESWYQNNKDKF